MKNYIFKDFLKYTSLNVLGMIGLSCYILADTFFIANGVGEIGLSALNLAYQCTVYKWLRTNDWNRWRNTVFFVKGK